MPLSRNRSTQHKVHIPASARENQYLLARFAVTDELITRISGESAPHSASAYKKFYQAFATKFFDVCNTFELQNSQLIANNKFTRIRFSPEKLTAQSEQQIVFLYHPKYHFSQNAYYDANQRVEKIDLLFLASGDDIRQNAALFHQKVIKAVNKFTAEVGIDSQTIRIRDHQHLTYDLFAREKGVEGNHAHKLRAISKRYAADNTALPDNTDELTYAIVDMHLNQRLRQLVDLDEKNDFSPLYNYIADAFIAAAKKHQLHNGAIIANGLVPIVRRSENESVISAGELLMLAYNPENTEGGYTCKWSADKLVDTIQFIFVASHKDKHNHGYGKFLMQIEQSLASLAEQLDYQKSEEELLVRFHQHIGFFSDK